MQTKNLCLTFSLFALRSFSRMAVSGSKQWRTSFTRSETDLPTLDFVSDQVGLRSDSTHSCAPIRMTMDFGVPATGFLESSLSRTDCFFLAVPFPRAIAKTRLLACRLRLLDLEWHLF
ncbi:hypothetical protein IG631_00409 [Alternaria alternata]|nr:hypothetical protein IG631_00409 [Alternaria alternata]